ncbi:MAG TPA: hypothetical protein VFM36_12270 [Thermoanaerobaculia bacterium]|nr:hypothetical protein [Thermoanaerobaculia bacterium]
MSAVRCPLEDELLDALGRGYVNPDLAAHVGGCSSCSELQLVAGALLNEHATAVSEAPMPSAGTVWWRMQIRHRHEVQAAARRSLFVGQAATLAIALILVGAFFGVELTVGLREMVAAVRLSTPLMVTVGAWLLLLLIAPIAGYVAIRQK